MTPLDRELLNLPPRLALDDAFQRYADAVRYERDTRQALAAARRRVELLAMEADIAESQRLEVADELATAFSDLCGPEQ